MAKEFCDKASESLEEAPKAVANADHLLMNRAYPSYIAFFFQGPQDNRIFEYFFVQFFAELQRIFRGIRCQAKRQESQRFLPETRGGFWGW